MIPAVQFNNILPAEYVGQAWPSLLILGSSTVIQKSSQHRVSFTISSGATSNEKSKREAKLTSLTRSGIKNIILL